MRLETEARGGLLSKEDCAFNDVPTMCTFNDARSPSSMIASRPDTKIEARGLCCARWESRQTQDWLRFDYCCCSVNNVHTWNSILLLFSEICSPTEQALTIIVVVHTEKSILVLSIILGGHECPVLSFTFSQNLHFDYPVPIPQGIPRFHCCLNTVCICYRVIAFL